MATATIKNEDQEQDAAMDLCVFPQLHPFAVFHCEGGSNLLTLALSHVPVVRKSDNCQMLTIIGYKRDMSTNCWGKHEVSFPYPKLHSGMTWVQCFGWPVFINMNGNRESVLVWLCYDGGIPSEKHLCLIDVDLKDGKINASTKLKDLEWHTNLYIDRYEGAILAKGYAIGKGVVINRYNYPSLNSRTPLSHEMLQRCFSVQSIQASNSRLAVLCDKQNVHIFHKTDSDNIELLHTIHEPTANSLIESIALMNDNTLYTMEINKRENLEHNLRIWDKDGIVVKAIRNVNEIVAQQKLVMGHLTIESTNSSKNMNFIKQTSFGSKHNMAFYSADLLTSEMRDTKFLKDCFENLHNRKNDMEQIFTTGTPKSFNLKKCQHEELLSIPEYGDQKPLPSQTKNVDLLKPNVESNSSDSSSDDSEESSSATTDSEEDSQEDAGDTKVEKPNSKQPMFIVVNEQTNISQN